MSLPRIARELDLHPIIAIDRQIGASEEPAAGPDRRAFHPHVLRKILRKQMPVDDHRRRRIAHHQPADLARRRQIRFHRGRRDEQEIGEVVEAGARVVGGKHGGEIELLRKLTDGEQVANGVRVLGSREATKRRNRAGIRIERGRAIELRLEIRNDGVVAGLVGSRPTGRRHRARAKLRATCARSATSSISPAVFARWL